jgi:ABC-type branched-chain amino acid transport systems, periplasmic component
MRLLKLLLPTYFLIALLVFIGQDIKAIQNPDGSGKTVKIGLLIPDKNAMAAVHGAEMAIRKANEKGGFKGKPFRLEVRSMEGPWGTGSKQAVSLVFDENVCALMGSHDGRNAHLVEQVAAKTRKVFLSAWASDPTLSLAFVPWYFSCVPNDYQQADALIEEIYTKRKITKIAVVSDNDYDSKLALESFVKKTKIAGNTDPLQLFYDNLNQNFNAIIDQINKADIKGIILFGQPNGSLRLIQQLQQRKIKQPIFGSFALLDEDEISDQDLKYYKNIILIYSDNRAGSKYSAFSEEFKKTYGRIPGPVAAYSFDGMNLLIEAIKNSGTDREKIQNYLSGIHYVGVTGPIQFDERGNRMGTPHLMEIKNGIPVSLER